MITFNKIVNKLCKMESKVLSIFDIWCFINPDFSPTNNQKWKEIYKLIYRLKACNIIIPIKNSLYFVNNKKNYREIDLIDKYYWSILKKLISQYTYWDYYIWCNKALELHLKDYSLPNQVIVYTKDIQKTIKIAKNYTLLFKTIKSWKKHENKNIFNKLILYTKNIEIDGIKFRISNEELSVLDALLVRNNKSKLNNYLIEKFLKKYSRFLSREIMWKLVSLKYITSINRLKKTANKFDEKDLYDKCLDIIKVEGWGCFIQLKN